jgi:hypothetical protein
MKTNGNSRIARQVYCWTVAFGLWAAHVDGAPIPGLFNTGVDNGGAALPDNSVDPHYSLIVNADSASTNAIVQDSTVFPIGGGPWVANNASGKWIGPRFNTGGAAGAGGIYVYRLHFDLTGLDPASARIDGRWATDNPGIDIRINGAATGNANTAQFVSFTPFVITNGFVAGLNTLDFEVRNDDATTGYTGLRVEVSGTALPPGSPPVIVSQPKGQCVSEGQPVTFTVTAQGSPAPAYQWRYEGGDLPSETNPSFTIPSVGTFDAGNYDVVVSNPAGSVTSVVARLTAGLAMTNPSFEVDSFATYPGYVSDNGPITGWNSLGNHGINPISDGQRPFADNGTIPDRRQVAFLQGDGPMSQAVNGFTAGEAYYVHYFENARGGNVPALAVTIEDSTNAPVTIVAAHVVNSVGGSNPYYEVTSQAFTATAAEMRLSFIKSNPRGGDNTVLIDSVCIVQIQSNSPPFITQQPEDLCAEVCQPAMLSVTAIGGLPLSYQWRKDGNNIGGATNTSFSIAMVSELDEAGYSVVAANAFGSVTSRVAQLTVFEPIPDLFNTGVDSNAEALPDNSVDPHYILFVNPDGGSPNAIVQDSTVFPIGGGPWLANSAISKWIGPQLNTAGSAAGRYIYRTLIDLTGRDPSTVVILGRWATDNPGVDILVNGISTGNPPSPVFTGYTSFAIASSNATFIAGPNTIDFVVDNSAVGYTGLRVEIDKSNVKIPPGTAPRITRQPRPRSLKVAVGDTVVINAKAAGSAPLSYQWKRDGVDVPGQTQPTLNLTNVSTVDSGDYTVCVTNAAGSVASERAVVCVCFEVVPGIFGTGIDNNNALLASGAVDPHYTLTVSADGSYPGPSAFVVNEEWPIAPAGPWLSNGPASKWIAPRAEQNQVSNPSFGNQPGNYTFQTSFELFDVDLSRFALQGQWAVDNSGSDIMLNGSSTGITSPGFTDFRAFFFTNGLMIGVNTMDFIINNAGTAVSPAGLRVDLRGVLTIQPRLSIARQGARVIISWTPKCPGQQLQCATELLSAGTQWQTIVGATSPHSIDTDQPMKFFRVLQ